MQLLAIAEDPRGPPPMRPPMGAWLCAAVATYSGLEPVCDH